MQHVAKIYCLLLCKYCGLIYICITKANNMKKTYTKKTKSAYHPRFINGVANPLNSQFAQATEKQKEQLKVTDDSPASWMNADGTKNWDKYNLFLEEREAAKWASKSF